MIYELDPQTTKSFKSMVEYDPNTVMVVDAINLGYRYLHAKSSEFAEDYISVVESLRKSYRAQYVILVCDEGSSSYRKSIYSEYKANRSLKRAEQTPEEELEFKMFFQELMSTLTLIQERFPVLRYKGVEADDTAAYLTQVLTKHFDISKIWLISTDSDWDLLVSPIVSRFSYVTRKEVTFENWGESHDYSIEDYISIKCLQGDQGDNVRGVKGIGPKRAVDLVKQYGTALDIVAALPIASKYKHIQELNLSANLIMLNYQLMDLLSYHRLAIGEANIASINATILPYLKDIKKCK